MTEQDIEQKVADAIAESCVGREDYVRQGAYWGAMARVAIKAFKAAQRESYLAQRTPF